MYNPAGFNSAGLGMDPNLGDPRRQENLPGSFATQGQAVSAPYAEANMVAASNTNPMNAVSQEPGKDFLQGYLQKSAPELGQRADFNLLNPFTWGEAFKTKEAAGRGELNIDEKRSSPILSGALSRHAALEEAKRQARGY
jgi:hypothetical protein